MTRLIAALALLSLLAACGGLRQSKLNPFNWFGKSQQETVAATKAEVVDPRVLVDQVAALRVDHAPGGAIVTALGLPEGQGYWQAGLVAQNGGKPVKGVLSFELRLMKPARPQPVGTPASREIAVAVFVSEQALDGVKKIEVIAANNRRSASR